MTPPSGRVYRSGDDPRIEHPRPEPDGDGPAAGTRVRGEEPAPVGPLTPRPTELDVSVRDGGPAAAPDHPSGYAEPAVPSAVGDGIYRSSGWPPDAEAGVDAAVTGVLPPVPGPDQVAAAPGDTGDGGRAGVFRNSAVMAAFNLLSRLLGYGRTVAIGATLGVTIGNAYTTAVYAPQMLYELLMGGTLTSVVVPLLVRARKRDPDGGEAFTQRFATLAAALLLGVAAVVTICSPIVSWIVVPRDAPYPGVVTSLGYAMLPAIFLMGMSALFQAILNTRGSFAAPTWAPILNNVVIIGFFVMFGLIWSDEPTVRSMTPTKIAVLGIGFTFAMFVQVSALVPALRKVGFRLRPRLGFRGIGLREIGRLSAWALCYVSISQVGMLVVLRIAGKAAGEGDTGAIVYDYGFLLMMTVNGIAAVSVMTALMPRMSAAAADHRYPDVAANLSLGTRLSSVLLIPGTAALAVFGPQIATVLFQYGHFGERAAQSTGLAIALAGFGLVPFAVSQLQIFTFYALPDTRTPALVNIPVVAVKVVFDLAVWAFADRVHVVPLLLLGNAVSFVVAGVVSYGMLRRRIGSLGLRRVAGTLSRLVLAGGIAAVPAWLVVHLVGGHVGDGRPGALAELATGGIVLAVVYFVVAYLLRVREVSDVVGMVRARLGRG